MFKVNLLVIIIGFISCLLLQGCVSSDFNPDSKRDNQPWNEGTHQQGYPGFAL